jgi:hypothetical protein
MCPSVHRSCVRLTVRLEGSSAHTQSDHHTIRSFFFCLFEKALHQGSPHPLDSFLLSCLGATHDSVSYLHSVWCHHWHVWCPQTDTTNERKGTVDKHMNISTSYRILVHLIRWTYHYVITRLSGREVGRNPHDQWQAHGQKRSMRFRATSKSLTASVPRLPLSVLICHRRWPIGLMKVS